jgi:nitroreductase
MAGAQVGVVVCGDTEELRRPGTVYWIIDCSAALENAMIAAAGHGLGACWLGIHPTPERIDSVRELLGVPEHVEPLGMIALGWPAETRPPVERYDETRIHRERW